MLTNSITTPKSLPTSQILATAALQVWSGLAVCMQNTEGKVDPKHHIDASAALLQVQSVCDLLGGHAKFKKRNNDIKTCTLATKALAANFVVLKECRHKKDPDKKLRPALTKAVESLDKRPKHMTEDDEDWSLEDKETKAFQAAFEKITNVADDIIMAHADLLNESSEKLFSLAVDKIEAQIRSLEPVAGGCSNGKIWHEGFGAFSTSDACPKGPAKTKLMAFFNATLAKVSPDSLHTVIKETSEVSGYEKLGTEAA